MFLILSLLVFVLPLVPLVVVFRDIAGRTRLRPPPPPPFVALAGPFFLLRLARTRGGLFS
jgi:hypothetical protein